MAIVIPVELDTSAFSNAVEKLKDKAKSFTNTISSSFKQAQTKLKDALSGISSKFKAVSENLTEGFKELGDVAGLPVDIVEKLAKSISNFATAAGPAGPIVIGLGVAFIGLAAAVVLPLAGLVKLTLAGLASAKTLSALRDAGYKAIPAELVASLESANTALTALNNSTSLVSATVAGAFAPAIQAVTTYLIAFVLKLDDFIARNSSLLSLIPQVGAVILSSFLSPVQLLSAALGTLLQTAAGVAELLGLDLASTLQESADAFLAFSLEGFIGSLDDAAASVEDYLPKANALIAATAKIEAGEKKAAKATKAATAAQTTSFTEAQKSLLALRDAAIFNIATEEERIALSAQASREAAANAAEEAMTATKSAEKRRMISQELQDTISAINEKELADYKAIQDKEVEAAKQAAAQKQQLLVSGISEAQGGLASIIGLIGGPVAGAIAGLVLNLGETISKLLEEIVNIPQMLKDLPKQITGFVVTVVDEVIPALVEAIPDIVSGLIMAVTSPEFLGAIVKLALYFGTTLGQAAFWIKVGKAILKGFWAAFLQGWEYFASGEMMKSFWEAVTTAWFASIAHLKHAFEKFIALLKEIFTLGFAKTKLDKHGGENRKGAVWDVIKEIFTMGQAETQYGDTPNMRQAGPSGETARFAPGDFFAAARTPEGLLAQALSSAGAPVAPAPVQVDLAYGHRAFDALFTRAARMGGKTTATLRYGRNY